MSDDYRTDLAPYGVLKLTFSIPNLHKRLQHSSEFTSDVQRRFGIRWRLRVKRGPGELDGWVVAYLERHQDDQKYTFLATGSIELVNCLVKRGLFERQFRDSWGAYMVRMSVLQATPGFRIGRKKTVKFRTVLCIEKCEDSLPLRFNFYDEFASDFVFLVGDEKLYAKKTLLVFHSPVFAAFNASGQRVFKVDGFEPEAFEIFLQTLHGAPVEEEWIEKVAAIARKYAVFSVIRRLEDVRILNGDALDSTAIACNMRRFIKTAINADNGSEFVDKMSGETMKVFTSRVFDDVDDKEDEDVKTK